MHFLRAFYLMGKNYVHKTSFLDLVSKDVFIFNKLHLASTPLENTRFARFKRVLAKPIVVHAIKPFYSCSEKIYSIKSALNFFRIILNDITIFSFQRAKVQSLLS